MAEQAGRHPESSSRARILEAFEAMCAAVAPEPYAFGWFAFAGHGAVAEGLEALYPDHIDELAEFFAIVDPSFLYEDADLIISECSLLCLTVLEPDGEKPHDFLKSHVLGIEDRSERSLEMPL